MENENEYEKQQYETLVKVFNEIDIENTKRLIHRLAILIRNLDHIQEVLGAEERIQITADNNELNIIVGKGNKFKNIKSVFLTKKKENNEPLEVILCPNMLEALCKIFEDDNEKISNDE